MGFIGNLLGTVSDLTGQIAGEILPLGSLVKKGGSYLGEQARKIPFKKGGMVSHMMPDGSRMKGKSHRSRKTTNPIIAEAKKMKGTQAMKDKMKRLRAMRGKGKK
jgi:hypothetical protein